MLRAALILLICFFAAGCQDSGSIEARERLKVRLACTRQVDCSLMHIALVKGFFREEGVDVLPMLHSFGRQALETVLDGKADLATVAETPFMLATLRGEKLSIVASIFSSGKNHAVVARNLGEGAKPKDLRGKRIGFVPGTTSDLFLSTFLTAHNITAKDVVQVPMQPDDMADAMMTGRVDAVSVWMPHLKSIARKLGGHGTVFYDQDIYTETFLLAGGTAYVRENKELVLRVLRAMLKAEEFASRHPAEARAMLSVSLNFAPDLLRDIWSESSFRVSLEHSLLINLEEETRWALRHGLVPDAQMPNYLERVEFGPLRALKPEAVDVNQVMSDEIRR